MRPANNALALTAILAWLTACGDPAPPAGDASSPESADVAAGSAPPPEAADTPPSASKPATPASATSASGAPAFVGTVWKVVKSDGVQAGTTYTFHADGSLVIASAPGNPPGQGKWTYADGKLAIEEEGVSYPTDILRLDATHFDLRSHHPGGALDIQMVAP